jgi:hypothetical protein
MSPLAFHNFRTTQTTLDLNGPILSFSQPPESVYAVSGIATFVGIATATFPQSERATNSGTISYQWYDASGPLSDGTYVTGSATTTLTLSNMYSAENNNKEYYLRATYNSSAYGSPGAGKSTGNAINSPLDSDNAVLTVFPTITFTTQPQDSTTAVGENATFIAIPTLSDNSFAPITQFWTLNGTQVFNQPSPFVSGAGSTTLTIEQPVVGLNTIQSSAYVDTAIGRVQAYSNVADFTGVAPRNQIKLEGYSSANAYASTTLDLDSGAQTITSSLLGSDYNLLTFHATEKDVNVKLTIKASKGSDAGSYSGGEGGTSVITFTATEDTEHTLIGVANNSAVFLYRGSNLIAVVGQGGNAGTTGNGGDGGGVNVSGSDGEGRQPGNGGTAPVVGTLSLNGVFGSTLAGSSIDLQIGDSVATAPAGGRTISCSKGSYWTDLGVAACSNNSSSNIQFVNIDGTTITSSDSIIRGFKAGYTISNTSGAGVNDGGRGGNGAVGGEGGTTNSGGGGGSGYTDGSVTVVSSTLGGNNTTQSSVKIEVV